MKRILITGEDSYIGVSLEKWLLSYPEKYEMTTIDMKDSGWKGEDFSKYDVVFHVAGIAHSDTGNADEETKKLYYKVNTDLTVEVAQKAKEAGVTQFIFMSSIIVYGNSRETTITKNTVPTPANFYGDSKLQAEVGVQKLESNNFRVAILRPPMIYGNGSKGNYPKLATFAKKFPLFPDIDNQRSMLHIDNLCEFIKLVIDYEERGIFFPQNKEYVKTSGMVRVIAEVHGKKIRLTKIFNPLLGLLGSRVSLINKVFGNLIYEKSMSDYKINYQIRSLRESVELTEQ